MDTFPPDITRESLTKELQNNQLELSKEVRQKFSSQLVETISNCKSETTLVFPENLWSQHKKQITMELRERFGSILAKTVTKNGQTYIYTDILLEGTQKSGPPENLHSIKIIFDKN